MQSKINKLREDIKADLVLQFKARDFNSITFLDLIDDYMEFWDIKNRLIQDIKTRGVNVKWHNGKQEGLKKNDSTGDLVKINNQMLKILDQLNLEAPHKLRKMKTMISNNYKYHSSIDEYIFLVKSNQVETNEDIKK